MRADTCPEILQAAGIFLVVSLVGSLVSVGTAEAETRGWADGESKQPSMTDLIPEPKSAEAYSERYSMSAKLDGGGKVVVKFTISNLGWGDKHGAAQVRVNLPDHDNYSFQKKVDSDQWSYSKDSFELDIADTTVKGRDDGTFEFRHEGDVKVDLEMSSRVPMWQPGRGRLDVDGGFMEMDLFGLRGTVEGRVHIGGKWKSIKSTRGAYADHVATNIAPYDLADRFSRTRIYDDENDIFVLWREVKLTGEHGGESINWVVVGYKDQIVLADADADVQLGKMRKDKVGYEIPHAVQVEGKSGEDKIKLVLRASDMERKNLLERYGSVVRTFAKTVSEPYNYYFDCDYALQMAIEGAQATVRGEGGYVVDYLNKP